MVNIFKRTRKLQTLLNIRVGKGAALLPTPTTATQEYPAVTRLHLTYAQKIYGGHQGARHFWRNCLTRLKYHNPAIPITVKQITDQEAPASLTVYFAEKISNAASLNNSTVKDEHAPPPSEAEKTAVVDVRNLTYVDIWNKFRNMTGAQDVPPTEEEEEQIKKYQEMDKKSVKDRARVAAIRQAKLDHEAMLRAAKGEVEKLRQG
ncbi:mitochondrial 54S ribosomal protein mL61 [Aspergillus undulatus]|uniref:mitochondrial 54S ribosomal protein mL61 n=1 Tax=Aspergillus undulatus TaxID=1810928 RepID=UPI003CCCA214